MFVVNEDNSIYATRGDIVFFSVSAEDKGVKHTFKAGDVLRIKVYGKKNAEDVVLQKDFPVTEDTEMVEIFLTEEDTKIGEVISKPKDYWYEVELNPLNNPQTIIGYDEDGAKVFKLFPEGDDIPEFVPDPEDFAVMDDELDMTSTRPVENQAIARAVAQLDGKIQENKRTLDAKDNTLHARLNDVAESVAMEQARLDIIMSGSTVEDGAEIADLRVGVDGTTYGSAGTAVRSQINNIVRHADYVIQGQKTYINIDTTRSVIECDREMYVFYNNLRYRAEAFSVSYAGIGNTFYVALNVTNNAIECVGYENYNRNTHLVLFTVGVPFLGMPNGCSATRYLVNGVDIFEKKSPAYGVPFFLDEGALLAFNTTDEKMTISNTFYLDYAGNRVNTTETEFSYSGFNVNVLYFVYDSTDSVFKFIDYSTYDAESQVIAFMMTKHTLNVPESNSIRFKYKVDGVSYNSNDVGIAYVSHNGSDSNDGSKKAPFRTIQKALDSGAEKVVVGSGTYKESITCVDRPRLQLMCAWDSEYNTETNVNRDRVVIDLSDELSLVSDSATSLLACNYSADESSNVYKMFVSKTMSLKDSGTRSEGYYANLWRINSNTADDTKLIPVLSLNECQATANTWFYDGSKIYANAKAGIFKIENGNCSGARFGNIKELCISDFEFKFASDANALIYHCDNVLLKNCAFSHSGLSEGVSFNYSNGIFENCHAFRNRNDGFNFHGFGTSSLMNCVGEYNYDDGVSHHDGCNGSINGGLWHHNGKGGISSPTYGSVVNIYNAVIFGNEYGIYAIKDTRDSKTFVLSGCAIYDNDVGLNIKNYNCLAINTALDNVLNHAVSGNGDIVTK